MITQQWENIGPDRATKYLETMDGNRTVRQTHVDYLHGQMKSGLWRKTHQGIAFDDQGRLVDGQHRMWAIVESGCTVPIFVTRGLSADDVVVVDTGIARGYADTAHYQGWDVDPLTASLAKLLAMGPTLRTTKVPFDMMRKWYEHYKDGIDFALKLRLSSRPSTGKSITAAMAGAFAAAYYHVDPEQLSRMGEIIKNGQMEYEADRAAFTLRDAWLSGRIGKSASEQYSKTECAIRAFSDRRPIKHLQRGERVVFEAPKLPVALRYRAPSKSTHVRTRKAAPEEPVRMAA